MPRRRGRLGTSLAEAVDGGDDGLHVPRDAHRARAATRPPVAARGRARQRGPRFPPAGSASLALETLRQRGALFVEDLAIRAKLDRGTLVDGLWDLVGRGAVTGDGFQPLRDLLSSGRSSRKRAPQGRWSLLERGDSIAADNLADRVAGQLLARYGVVFRELVVRESFTVPWREVLRALRRREARGGVRGGRFVAGFIGEQYALPEAVEGLRRVRREERTGESVRIRPCDPLNLVGILLPGPRVPAQHGVWIELRDGAVASAEAPAPRRSNATAAARS